MKPFILLQHLVPQQLLSRAVGKVAASENVAIKTFVTHVFAKAYGISLAEYARQHMADYANFNDFFTRELAADARSIHQANNSLVCPADGVISQLGSIQKNRIFQAKGQAYTLEKLLASRSDAPYFYDGQFATVYLAPSNYHRVHMPLAGTLTCTRYVPGQLFSVNNTTAANVPNLFARNERMVCLFDVSHAGKTHKMAVILVGAMIVAGIETVATGKITPSKTMQTQTHCMPLAKGAELGRFYLGSTAIVLLPKGLPVTLVENWQAGSTVQMGQCLGHLVA